MQMETIILSIPTEILPMVAKRKKDIPARVYEHLVLELYRLCEHVQQSPFPS